MKRTQDTYIDKYCNISRHVRYTQDEDFVLIASGSSGTSIAVKGRNNGHVQLSKSDVLKIVLDLTKAVVFSARSKARCVSFWEKKKEFDKYVEDMTRKT